MSSLNRKQEDFSYTLGLEKPICKKSKILVKPDYVIERKRQGSNAEDGTPVFVVEAKRIIKGK